MNNSRVSRKLQALLEMSRRGTSHERAIAAERLEYFLGKYDVTIDDIDPANRRIYTFRYRTKYEKRLLLQIKYMVTDSSNDHNIQYIRAGKNKIAFDLTSAQYAEVSRLYTFYRRELRVEMDRLLVAFIHANNIFGEDSSDTRAFLDEETLQMLNMASAIRATTPYHLLDDRMVAQENNR